MRWGRAVLLAACAVAVWVSPGASKDRLARTADSRASLIARAQVWTRTDVASKNLTLGPREPGAFLPGETVSCDYLAKQLNGHSRKFACGIGPDEMKVKFGGENGEVYGEVAATRLLWALGFGADMMYPVRILCRGCPDSFGPATGSRGERLIEPAVIERKMPGREPPGTQAGWSWVELNLTDERLGGATAAERDALTLLAVLVQHTDSKPEQQRLMCLEDDGHPDGASSCDRPFMLINDLGLTFGRGNVLNASAPGSVNLQQWSHTPVWKYSSGCIGNLPRSFTGTLKDPLISEPGRRLLADLLAQLSDAQLHDLFAVARVDQRLSPPAGQPSPADTIDDWVRTFKQKRTDIAARRCDVPWSTLAPPTFGTGAILWLQSWSSPALTAAMNGISLLGYPRVYMAFAVVLALAWRLGAGARLLLLLALTATMTSAMKVVVSSPRPDTVDSRVQSLDLLAPGHLPSSVDTLPDLLRNEPESAAAGDDGGYGFPSGHVASATVFCVGLAMFFEWPWAWYAMSVWIPAVALSRMYLGRHFPGDVLGGLAVAVIATAAALLALNLTRFDDGSRGGRIAGRTVVTAVAIAVCALALGIPATHQAGVLLGAAIGAFWVAWHSHPPIDASAGLRMGRVVVAALLYFSVERIVPAALAIAGATGSPGGAIVAGALPVAVLFPGPFYVERLIGAWRSRVGDLTRSAKASRDEPHARRNRRARL